MDKVKITPIADNGKSTTDSLGFWATLVTNPIYLAISEALLKTPRRRLAMLSIFPIVWIIIANIGPIMQMGRISFLEAYPLTVGEEMSYTLDNWLSFFQRDVYWVPFFRTLLYATSITAITLVITYPVAYFLAKHVTPSRQMLFLLLLLVPFWVGEIVRTFAIMILLGNRGAVNLVLQWVGLSDGPIPFMYTTFSVALGSVYLASLYMLLPLYSSLEKIPNSYLEAAADLGAGAWQRLLRVTLPLSKDGIASGCTLVFLISTGFYALPVLLGGPNTTTFAETIGGFFHVAGDKWPIGAAFACIMLVTTLSATGIFLKIMGRSGKGAL